MQKHLFALLVTAGFLPSLYAVAYTGSSAPTMALAAVLTTGCLYLVIYNPMLKNWLRTPWPFPLMIIGQCLLMLAAKTGMSGILTPLAFMFAVSTLRHSRLPWIEINRFSVSLHVCLLMWPTTGSPLPALGLFIFTLVILFNQQRVRPEETAARTLLLAATTLVHPLLATLPAIAGFSLLATWPKRAAFVAVLGTAVATAILTYLPQSQLTTATLYELIPDPTTALAAIALLTIVTIQSIYHWRWWPPYQHAAWMLGALTYTLTLPQLAQTGSFALWSSAPLLTLALPLVVHTLLRPTFRNR